MDFVELTSNYAMKSIFVLDTTDWMIAGIIAFILICVAMRLAQQKRICNTQAVAAVLLATYLFLIFCSTVIARPNLGVHSYQLQPFWSYKEVMEKGRTDLLAENLLNVGMLVPIGFLLPLLSRRIKFRHVIFAAFLISYTIELSQLIFCKGLFELVDDPFHNVLGAIVGYGIYRAAWLCVLEKQYH